LKRLAKYGKKLKIFIVYPLQGNTFIFADATIRKERAV
jgi:hypothetical protein